MFWPALETRVVGVILTTGPAVSLFRARVSPAIRCHGCGDEVRTRARHLSWSLVAEWAPQGCCRPKIPQVVGTGCDVLPMYIESGMVALRPRRRGLLRGSMLMQVNRRGWIFLGGLALQDGRKVTMAASAVPSAVARFASIPTLTACSGHFRTSRQRGCSGNFCTGDTFRSQQVWPLGVSPWLMRHTFPFHELLHGIWMDDWTDGVSFVGPRILLFHCLLSLNELLLPHFQLQHDSTQLHVQIVGPLQLSFIVFTDVQGMPELLSAPADQFFI